MDNDMEFDPIACHFCDEYLYYIKHGNTAIWKHRDNGCEFITFQYDSNKNIIDLTDYLEGSMPSKEKDEELYANEPYIKGILCPSGHQLKREILTDLRDEYPYYCLTCDENYFTIETVEAQND